jgi:hypothetical protein
MRSKQGNRIGGTKEMESLRYDGTVLYCSTVEKQESLYYGEESSKHFVALPKFLKWNEELHHRAGNNVLEFLRVLFIHK